MTDAERDGPDPRDLDRLEGLFEAARGLAPEERAAFLAEVGESDPELGRELESLLEHAAEDPEFLERLRERVVGPRVEEALQEVGHRRLAEALRGRYRLRDRIGRGGMATVYLADDLRHERRVALKVLEADVTAAVGAERFLAEIRTTANLQHPHILPLFDSGEAAGRLYYVMPYVEGESLRSRLERERQLPVEEAVRIGRELADALDYAHRQGVIHRDVKPGNVLLHEGTPFLMDFGIALALEGDDRGAGRLTETGRSLGTPLYMSPEQATGEGAVGPPSDVYGLGCVLHEMLVGEPPHTGPTAQAVLGKIVTEEVEPLRERRATVPAHVDAAVRRALEKLPADRFQSAGAFGKALGDVGFRHGAVEAGAPGEAAASGRPRWIGPALVGALAVVLLGVGAWWALARGGPGEVAADGPAASSLAVEAPPPGPGAGGPAASRPSLAAPSGADTRPSIAVLPFRDMSASGDQAYFGEGVAEEILNALAKVPGLRVAARTSAFRLRNEDLAEVARRLSVAAVLEGSIRREGDSVRITAQLIDGRNNFHLWSDQYDREIGSVIAIQEDIAQRVVRELSPTLTRGPGALTRAGAPDPGAYDRYLRGRSEWNAREARGSIAASVDHFREALRLDPDFALAYSGLADAYVLLFEHNDMSPEEALPLARAAAERALQLDSTLAEAHTSLAEVLAAERRWGAAEDRFRRALEINPGYVTAHHWYGWLLSHLARHDEAIEYLRGARVLDPLSAIVRTDLAAAYYHAGRFEEAVEEVEACREARICVSWGRVYGRALLALGRAEEALNVAREVPDLVVEAMALADLGRTVEARRVMEEYVSSPERTGDTMNRPITHLYLAEMQVAIGDHAAALDAIQRAEELGLATGPVLIREWPRFAPIRDDPRYRRVVERMGYPPRG